MATTSVTVRMNESLNEIITDPFYNEFNQARLREAITEFESGNARLIVRTMEELEAMANE